MERAFGRLERFEDDSRRYSIREFVFEKEPEAEPKNMTWNCSVVLDQGTDGSCVGHAWAHELAAEPAPVGNITHEVAVELYYDAQRNDPWPGGSYPGASTRYEGSSVLGGAKACMMYPTGIGGYYWAFNIDDLVLGIGYHGPSVLGIKWYSGMNELDDTGLVKPTGRVMGGHAILARGVDVDNERIMLHNSWGPDWGAGGKCYISFDDMEKLLKDGGESCFALGRRTEPMVKDSYL